MSRDIKIVLGLCVFVLLCMVGVARQPDEAQGRALARHEHHFVAVVAANAEVGEGVAKSFVINDSESSHEVFLQTKQFAFASFHDNDSRVSCTSSSSLSITILRAA